MRGFQCVGPPLQSSCPELHSSAVTIDTPKFLQRLLVVRRSRAREIMEALFGSSKTPADRMKEYQRSSKKSIRESARFFFLASSAHILVPPVRRCSSSLLLLSLSKWYLTPHQRKQGKHAMCLFAHMNTSNAVEKYLPTTLHSIEKCP